MNIITGVTGQAHITPAQDSMWHRAMQGQASGVFDVGMKFAPVKVNNNTVRVQDGCLSIQGRFACLDPATFDDVTIANGTLGMSRIDIICARLSIDISSNPPRTVADLYVFQGEEIEGIPVVPEVPETDLDNADIVAYLPLIEVKINDLEIVELKMIADIMRVGGHLVYDAVFSLISENAVQNKVVAAAINEIDERLEPLDNMNNDEQMALRESRFVTEETAPSNDGQICWKYE